MKALGAITVALTVCGLSGAQTVFPVHGVLRYRLDIRSGEYWPVPDGGPRYGPGIAWDRNDSWRGFVGADADGLFREILDWADVGTPAEPVTANGFRFSYCTNGFEPVTVALAFYVDENGFATEDSVAVAVFQFSGLPGRDPDSGANCFQFDIDLPDPELDRFTLAGTDLDADGRVDFGYGYQILSCGDCQGQAGPLLADAPLATSPGSTVEWDVYSPAKYLGGIYVRTQSGAPDSLGQLALRIYTDEVIGCPLPGCDSGGIDVDFDGNCIINLNDLTRLLAGFGIASGATPDQGDTDGDGDVDLSDLTNLLGRFGNVCTG